MIFGNALDEVGGFGEEKSMQMEPLKILQPMTVIATVVDFTEARSICGWKDFLFRATEFTRTFPEGIEF